MELRKWTCPFCDGGLPEGLTLHAVKVAVSEHYATRHKSRDTSLKAFHKARAAQCQKNPALQPALKAGRARLAQAFRRKAEDVAMLAPKGSGHQLVVWQPHWPTWPTRKKGAQKRRGTFVTCRLCHQIGDSRKWSAPCVGLLGPRCGAQRALWKRIKTFPENLQSILALWNNDVGDVDDAMSQGVATAKAAQAGHDVAWFAPDWKSWPLTAQHRCRLLTCCRCLRISNADWLDKCRGLDATCTVDMCERGKKIKRTKHNKNRLLQVWGLTEPEIDKRLLPAEKVASASKRAETCHLPFCKSEAGNKLPGRWPVTLFWLASDLLNKVTAGRSPHLRGRETFKRCSC